MPIINISQLLGKTLYFKTAQNFYRVADVNKLGDKAKPVSNKLKPGYSFIIDSFLLEVPQPYYNYNSAQTYAKRSDKYFTFIGVDGNYYAVKAEKPNAFSLTKFTEQGVKTLEQQLAEEEEKNKTPFDKATDTIADFFGSTGKIVKNVIYISLGVWAIGYLIPKIKK